VEKAKGRYSHETTSPTIWISQQEARRLKQ